MIRALVCEAQPKAIAKNCPQVGVGCREIYLVLPFLIGLLLAGVNEAVDKMGIDSRTREFPYD